MGVRRLWWLSRPVVWRWRLGYWDWDAIKVALCFAALGRAPKVARPARSGGEKGKEDGKA